ncbi:MAG: GNAT family N-acetyltransferase [Anaerolineae bacterium]|nr:GNAT family N-acetyltransferase [Anaerolineae bacterium]
MIVEPVTLEGQSVRLEPLSHDHYADLCENVMGDDIWRWIFYPVKTTDEMHGFIETALAYAAQGGVLPFATIYENRVVGTTRYLNIDKTHHTIEIGTTVIGKPWQRTVVNTEAKYLMLRHAFEVLGCLRVQFHTDELNTASRNAIARLGAQQDGIIRNHRICLDGRVRNTVLFSITDMEWLAVKKNLEGKLSQSNPVEN